MLDVCDWSHNELSLHCWMAVITVTAIAMMIAVTATLGRKEWAVVHCSIDERLLS